MQSIQEKEFNVCAKNVFDEIYLRVICCLAENIERNRILKSRFELLYYEWMKRCNGYLVFTHEINVNFHAAPRCA